MEDAIVGIFDGYIDHPSCINFDWYEAVVKGVKVDAHIGDKVKVIILPSD